MGLTKRIPIVDPHIHLWELDRLNYPWLVEQPLIPFVAEHPQLQQDYTLNEFEADSAPFELHRAVHVEALPAPDQFVDETAWLQALADNPDNRGLPHGIVGAIDLGSADVQATIEAHCRYPNIRGLRQVLSWLPDTTLSDSHWRTQYGSLADHGLSFDLEISASQVESTVALVRDFPNVRVAINHNGLAALQNGRNQGAWYDDLRALADSDNVAIKLSGYAACYDREWTTEIIRPMIRKTIEIFGIGRCMFASNFPVERPFISYAEIWNAYIEVAADYTTAEQQLLLHDNAVEFYHLESR